MLPCALWGVGRGRSWIPKCCTNILAHLEGTKLMSCSSADHKPYLGSPSMPKREMPVHQFLFLISSAISNLKKPSSANEVASSLPHGVVTCCENGQVRKCKAGCPSLLMETAMVIVVQFVFNLHEAFICDSYPSITVL